MHTNRISCAILSKILKLKEDFFLFFFFFFTNHHTPLAWHLIHLSIFDRKIFIGILKPCPTVQLQQSTRITLLTKEHLPVKVYTERHRFLSFGDEVANTEEAMV